MWISRKRIRAGIEDAADCPHCTDCAGGAYIFRGKNGGAWAGWPCVTSRRPGGGGQKKKRQPAGTAARRKGVRNLCLVFVAFHDRGAWSRTQVPPPFVASNHRRQTAAPASHNAGSLSVPPPFTQRSRGPPRGADAAPATATRTPFPRRCPKWIHLNFIPFNIFLTISYLQKRVITTSTFAPK
jgi:hypothetical protein